MATTYSRVKVALVDGSMVRVFIGHVDRRLARKKFGYEFDLEKPNPQDEEWLAYLSFTAYGRSPEAKPELAGDFEAFQDAYLGIDDADAATGETPTPA